MSDEFDDDIELDDDFELEEMSFDEMVGGTKYPEPKNDREAIVQSGTKVIDGFTNSITDSDVETTVKDFINSGLPTNLKVNVNEVTDLHSTFKDELDNSLKEVKGVSHTLLSSLEEVTTEGGIGRSLIDKARGLLGSKDSDDYYQESLSEQHEKRSVQEVLDVFGEKEEQSVKNNLLTEQIAFYRNKKTNELQATNIALLTRNNAFQEKYTANFYRKSLELQFYSLYTSKELLRTTIESANSNKLSLSEIVKNTGLPDIIKQRKGEALQGMIRDDALKGIKDTLYSSMDFTNTAKSRIKDKLENYKDAIISTLGGATTIVDGMASTSQFGSKESMIGGLIANRVKEKVYGKVGDIYGKTKYGQKHTDLLDNYMLDPHETLSQNARKTDGLKSLMFGGLASLFKRDDINNDITIEKENLDGVAQFDNRTYTTLNTVIPMWFSKIYEAIKGGFGGKKESLTYDYHNDTFVSNESIKDSINTKVSKTIQASGTYDASHRLIDLFLDRDIKISRVLQRAIVSGFLRYLMDGKSPHPDKLFKSGLLSKQYFRPNVSKEVRKILKLYLYSGNNDRNIASRHMLFRVLNDMRDNIPSAKLLLHSDIKDKHIDGLVESGLLKIDDSGNRTIDMDSYKEKVVTSVRDNLNYKDKEIKEIESSDLDKYVDEKLTGIKDFKDEQVDKFKNTSVGKEIFSRVDRLSELDAVKIVESGVDGLKNIKVDDVIKTAKETVSDIQLSDLLNQTEGPIPTSYKRNNVPDINILSPNNIKTNTPTILYKDVISQSIHNLDKNKQVNEVMTYINKRNPLENNTVKDHDLLNQTEGLIPASYKWSSVKTNLPSILTKDNISQNIGSVINSVSKNSQVKDIIDVNTHNPLENNTVKGVIDNIKTTGTELQGTIYDLKVVKDIQSNQTVKNIQESEVYKTVLSTLKDRYGKIKSITTKDITDVTTEVTKAIGNGSKVSYINKILDNTLGHMVEEESKVEEAKKVAGEITNEIDDERVLLNMGPLGRLVKLTRKDSILRKNIFQLVSDVKEKMTGKGLDYVPSTLEAMMLPYKYAWKGAKGLGKGVGWGVKKGYQLGKRVMPKLNIDYRRGGSSIANTYGGALKGVGKLGLKTAGGVGSLVMSSLSKLTGMGYESSGKVGKAYSAIGEQGVKVVDPVVGTLQSLGNGIISTISKIANINYEKRNEDLAEKIDEKLDENRDSGKIRKGSWITRLANLGKKDDKPVIPTYKEIVKEKSSVGILSMLMGIGGVVTSILSGITSSLGLLGTISGGIMGMVGMKSLFGKLGKTVDKLGVKTTSKIAVKTSEKIASKVATKAVAKTAVKTVGKSLLKKVPGIGILAGIGFAINRFMDGDIVGGLGEIASGVVSTVPIIGTAGSVGLDVWLAKRDMDKIAETENTDSHIPIDNNSVIPESNITKPIQSNPTSLFTNNVDNKTTTPVASTVLSKKTPVNNTNYTPTGGNINGGKNRIMNYLAKAEGTTVHKNRNEPAITLPYGIYTKDWKNTKLEKYLKKTTGVSNLRTNMGEVNNVITTSPMVKKTVRDLAYDFYVKHFMDERVNKELNPSEQLIFFSNSVNGGMGRGVKSLQSAVGSTIDGGIGPNTISKIKEAKSKGVDIARGMLSYMQGYYNRLIRNNPGKYAINKNGWNNRLKNLDNEIGKTHEYPSSPTKNIEPINSVIVDKSEISVKPDTPHKFTEDIKVTPQDIPKPKTPIVKPPVVKHNVSVDTRKNTIDDTLLQGHTELYTRLDKQIEIQSSMLVMLERIYNKGHNDVEKVDKPMVVKSPEIINKELPPPIINLKRKDYSA